MIVDAALDLFLGSACAACDWPGRAICSSCAAGLPGRGRLCMPTPPPAGLAPVMAAGDYDGALKALVNAHKERGRLALAAPLGRVLAGVVADLVPGDEPLALVPVPSTPAVVRRRGHDPLLRITRVAAARLRHDGRRAAVRRVLSVVRRAQDQAGLGAEARQANLRGAFRARRPVGPGEVSGLVATVVVVDDVVTTGATAREAQRALEEWGTPVAGVAAIAATRRRHSLPLRGRGD